MTTATTINTLADTTLYFDSDSTALQPANTLNAEITHSYTPSEVQTAFGSETVASTPDTPVLSVVEAQTTVTAINYDAIIDSASGPTTLYLDNDTGVATSVLAGSGGGIIKMDDDSSASIVAGDGNMIIGNQSNTGDLDVTLGNGNDDINFINPDTASTGYFTLGNGNSIINLEAGSASIEFTGGGLDTVNAGFGYETVSAFDTDAPLLISENSSFLTLYNGTGNSTIRGGDGATTIAADAMGGGGNYGAVLWTAEDYFFFPLNGATPSDSVTDMSAGNDTLVAGYGSTTIDASQSTGNVLLETGSGNATMIGGSGSDTFELEGLSSGAHAITIENYNVNDIVAIAGFGDAPLLTAQSISGGNDILTLNDGTEVTFIGVTTPVTVSQVAGTTITTTGGITLYYDEHSVAATEAQTIATTLDNDFSAGQITTVGANADTTEVATSSYPVLNVTGGVPVSANNYVIATNFNTVVDSSVGPEAIYVTNDTGSGTSVLAGSGGGIFKMDDNSTATVDGGDGNVVIGDQSYTGNMNITLGNGNDDVNFVSPLTTSRLTIQAGSGNSIVNLYAGQASINFNGSGYDTVNAGTGIESVFVGANTGTHVLISENNSQLYLLNGTSAATVRGGAGSTTIAAGSGSGGVLFTAEDFFFFAPVGTPNDTVTDYSGNDTLVGGYGYTTIDASQSIGSDTLESGTGNSTLIGSLNNVADTFQIGGLSSGSHSITIENFNAGDTLVLQGFGSDSVDMAPPVVSGSNTILTLNDGTQVTFTDYTGTITPTYS